MRWCCRTRWNSREGGSIEERFLRYVRAPVRESEPVRKRGRTPVGMTGFQLALESQVFKLGAEMGRSSAAPVHETGREAIR
jgi:hypothetical protein